MKYIIISIVISLSFYCGIDVSALENGTWVRHERQAPINDIQSIYALPDGKLWVDTLSESDHNFHVFDGEKWKKTSKNSAVIGTNPPLISDSNGLFYFLNGESLVLWDYNSPDDAVQQFSIDGSGKLSAPLTTALSGDNILYLASFAYDSKGGIYRFDGETIEKIKSGPAKSIAVDSSGLLWATGKESSVGDMRLWVMEENGVWTDRTGEIDSELIDSDEIIYLTVETSPDSSVWVTNRGKYGVYKNGVWSYHDGGLDINTMSLTFDTAGGVWGFGNNDIYMLDGGGNWQMSYGRVKSSHSISGNYFMAIDSESNNWIFYINDIYMYSGEVSEEDGWPWVKVRSNLDLGSNIVTSIAYTDDGNLVCGHGVRGEDDYNKTEKAGISILIDSTWHNFNTLEGLDFRNVYDLLELEDGDIMVYADNSYIRLYTQLGSYHIEKVDSLFYPDLVPVPRDHNDMIMDKMGDVWLATTLGLLHHDFIDNPSLFYSPSKSINYFNIFQASNGNFFLQSSDDENPFSTENGAILYFNNNADIDKQWSEVFPGSSSETSMIRDFAVEVDPNHSIFWGIRNNNLVNNRKTAARWENVISADTGEEIFLPDASLIHMEEDDGLIWASGYDNTGYLEHDGGPENFVWHRIPEMAGYASSVFKRSESDKIALNAIVVNEFGNFLTLESDDDIDYYGVFEFIPGTPSIVSEDKPASFPVIANYPNPFNSSTTIKFELPRPEKVNITIYNMLGQHVKTLAEGIYPAGTINVLWDSKSDSGISVASGIYFYCIKTEKERYTGKLLLLR